MKTALFAALLVTSPALATPSDDFLACIVGAAMVEIHNDRADTALETAYSVCPEPQNLDPEEAEIVGDVANMAVRAIAEALN